MPYSHDTAYTVFGSENGLSHERAIAFSGKSHRLKKLSSEQKARILNLETDAKAQKKHSETEFETLPDEILPCTLESQF
jgi:hypothetical protein